MSELLPCPFCGNKETVFEDIIDDDSDWSKVECPECQARIHGDNLLIVRKAWNTRAQPPRPAESEYEIAKRIDFHMWLSNHTPESGSDRVANISKTIVSCPTCGSPCAIAGEEEGGTHYYVPAKSESGKGNLE